MNKKKYQKKTDLNLFDLIVQLWQKKLIILVGVTLSFLLSFYISNLPDKYSINLEINPVTNYDVLEYYYPNSFDFYKINKEKLINLFIEKLKERDVFTDGFINNNFLDQSLYNNYEDRIKKLQTIAYRIKFSKKKNKPIWTLSINGIVQKELFLKSLEYSLNLASSEVRKFLIEDILIKSRIEKKQSEDQVSQIQRVISKIILSHKYNIQDLEEQITIAKKLGIDKSLNVMQIEERSNLNQLYLRGYLPLEEELNMLKSRDINNINAKISQLRFDINSILEDKKLETAIDEFKKTSLYDFNKNFKSASYDMNDVKIKKTNNNEKVFTLLFLVGLITSIALAGASVAIDGYRKNN